MQNLRDLPKKLVLLFAVAVPGLIHVMWMWWPGSAFIHLVAIPMILVNAYTIGRLLTRVGDGLLANHVLRKRLTESLRAQAQALTELAQTNEHTDTDTDTGKS